MDKRELKHIIKKIVFAVIWFVVGSFVAISLTYILKYEKSDMLLLVGIVLMIAGSCATIDTDDELEEDNGKDVQLNNPNGIEIESVERGLVLKENLRESTTMIPLVFGGLCNLILAFYMF